MKKKKLYFFNALIIRAFRVIRVFRVQIYHLRKIHVQFAIIIRPSAHVLEKHV